DLLNSLSFAGIPVMKELPKEMLSVCSFLGKPRCMKQAGAVSRRREWLLGQPLLHLTNPIAL
ncbi:hypothetical protein, partial [Paenibacillus thiaminolyticus]